MSKFYGQVEGSAKTTASRRGNQEIKVSAQSWDGSVITRMFYEGDELKVEISISDGSDFYGYTHFCGSLDELKKKLA